MVYNVVSLLFLAVAFAVLYRYVIPFLFPSAVSGVGVVKVDKESDEVYLFQGGGVPIINSNNRAKVKADSRRRNLQYEKALV